jgi:hypothetical protein
MSTRKRNRSRTKATVAGAVVGATQGMQQPAGAAIPMTGAQPAQQRASRSTPSRSRTRSRSKSGTTRRSTGAVQTGSAANIGTGMQGNSLAFAAPLARECYNLLGRGLSKQQITAFVNAL